MKERLKKLFANVWNVPNVLTIIRLVLVPVFVAVFNAGHNRWALAVFCIASLTDALDGTIARKTNQITDFGKLFDPLADKLMVLTALFCQARAGVFPRAAIIIVLIKELYMVAGSVFMLGKNVVVSANYFGKTATVCFISSLILSFFHRELSDWGYPVHLWLLWISVALAILAMTVYTVQALGQIRKIRDSQNS
ncbi:MAG: CDP-diacylglycerol--glycerol-3-phosphate 3-phosphatidyltransferase [Clostridia bacterium]|nr:CDP-diacylglycerol--glycerol-3-phosphate 3-phosphatidyltransferase [Clostridia bacterium]